MIVHCPKGGALSDYIVIGQSNVLTVPKEIDFDEASSLTINYLTAYFSLVEIGGLKNGSSLFIQGAAGILLISFNLQFFLCDYFFW